MPDLDRRRRRALYRAGHRGTMEMDILLGRYASDRLPGMSEGDLAQFEAFLALPDPELNTLILNGAPDDDTDFAALLADVRTFHGIAAQG